MLEKCYATRAHPEYIDTQSVSIYSEMKYRILEKTKEINSKRYHKFRSTK